MIRLAIAGVILMGMIGIAKADINYVGGYSRSDGTYVQGHYKDTSADGNPYNNRRAVWGY